MRLFDIYIIMLKGIKLRLYLTGEQEERINSMLGSYRFVYNQCLSYRKERYESEGLNTSRSELSHYFHQELRNVHEWLKCHNTKVLKQSILNLEDAYKSFFKQGKGFPRFKSRRDEQKMRFPKEAVSSKTFDETSSRLNLTKDIKRLKFECSDRDRKYLYKNKEGIRSVTIKRTKTGKYFATVLIDGELLRQMDRPTNHTVGIDLGIKSLLTLSTGESIENPKWIRNNEKRLKRLQKQMSKKVKGSNNREKARLKLAVLHEKIKNQKQDYLHNITSKIINENQVIIIEDLNISGMMKNHNLAKSIQELGLYELQRQLEYKSKWYGRTLVFVDRWFPSSKTCSGCGWVNKNLTLKDREFTCHSCGLIIDRDLNASINIEIEGIRTLDENNIGQRLPEFTLVDSPLMDDKEETPLKSHDWLNQENDNMYNFVQV
jgi:putative transposase